MAKKDCFNAGYLVSGTIRDLALAFHAKDRITEKMSLEDAAIVARHLGRFVEGKAKRQAAAVMKTAARLSKQKAPGFDQVSNLLARAKKLRTTVASSCKTLPHG